MESTGVDQGPEPFPRTLDRKKGPCSLGPACRSCTFPAALLTSLSLWRGYFAKHISQFLQIPSALCIVTGCNPRSRKTCSEITPSTITELPCCDSSSHGKKYWDDLAPTPARSVMGGLLGGPPGFIYFAVPAFSSFPQIGDPTINQSSVCHTTIPPPYLRHCTSNP